jgi:hypothetical protein
MVAIRQRGPGAEEIKFLTSNAKHLTFEVMPSPYLSEPRENEFLTNPSSASPDESIFAYFRNRVESRAKPLLWCRVY